MTRKVAAELGDCAGLLDKEAAKAAALALRHLCDACGAAMAPHLDVLMSLYQRIQSAGEASTSIAGPSTHTALEETDVQQVGSSLSLKLPVLPFSLIVRWQTLCSLSRWLPGKQPEDA